SVTASSGCPERGDWSVELPRDLAPGEYIFEVKSISPKDGSAEAIDNKRFSVN
ncbi:MAG: Gmad2 immunoglobulin-like domain-containing protein, partial [Actinomycetota bacterium]